MKTIVRPVDVAQVVLHQRSDPKLVKEGLAILRLCAENKVLAHKTIGTGAGTPFQSIITGFVEYVERGLDPSPIVNKFPEWGVALQDIEVRREFLPKPEKNATKKSTELKSLAVSILNTISGSIMLLDDLFTENPKSISVKNMAPEKKLVRGLRKVFFSNETSQELKGKLQDLFREMGNFYRSINAIIENREQEIRGLDNDARQALKKRHWKALVAIRERVLAITLELPETVMI